MAIPVNRLGWMAGVIDLKGRLITKKNAQRATPQYVLMVETKEFGVVRELANMTGTRPELMAPKKIKEFMRRSCTEHCPEAHVHVADEFLEMPRMGRWTITGASMATVLDNLSPFLVVDKGWSELIEKIARTITLVSHGSGAVLASLRRLRDLGWDLPDQYAAAIEEE